MHPYIHIYMHIYIYAYVHIYIQDIQVVTKKTLEHLFFFVYLDLHRNNKR
jgi:hypothetical protein